MRHLTANFLQYAEINGESIAVYQLSNGAYLGITDEDFATYFNEEKNELQLPDLTVQYDPF